MAVHPRIQLIAHAVWPLPGLRVFDFRIEAYSRAALDFFETPALSSYYYSDIRSAEEHTQGQLASLLREVGYDVPTSYVGLVGGRWQEPKLCLKSTVQYLGRDGMRWWVTDYTPITQADRVGLDLDPAAVAQVAEMGSDYQTSCSVAQLRAALETGQSLEVLHIPETFRMIAETAGQAQGPAVGLQRLLDGEYSYCVRTKQGAPVVLRRMSCNRGCGNQWYSRSFDPLECPRCGKEQRPRR